MTDIERKQKPDGPPKPWDYLGWTGDQPTIDELPISQTGARIASLEAQLAGAVDALHEAIDAARTFNRGGMTWWEYDAVLARLASQHPRGR